MPDLIKKCTDKQYYNCDYQITDISFEIGKYFDQFDETVVIASDYDGIAFIRNYSSNVELVHTELKIYRQYWNNNIPLEERDELEKFYFFLEGQYVMSPEQVVDIINKYEIDYLVINIHKKFDITYGRYDLIFVPEYFDLVENLYSGYLIYKVRK